MGNLWKRRGREEDFLPAVEKGTTVKTEKAWMEEKETKAPPRHLATFVSYGGRKV